MEIQKKIRLSRVKSEATNREIQQGDQDRSPVGDLDSSTPLRSARNDRVLPALLLAVFFSGVGWAAMIPLWHTPDEQAHFAQGQNILVGKFPPGRANPSVGPSTSQDIVISEKLLGTFRDERGNNKFTYHPEYRLPYSNSVVGFNEEEIVKLPAAMRKVFLINEATGYPPVYYWYIALVNKLIWGQDLITRVFAGRVATVLISSLGVLAAYGIGKEVFVSRTAALAAAALFSFMPMRLFVGSGVTSDAMINTIYPLALLFLIKLAVKSSRKYFWLSMVMIGVAMGVKLQSVFLIPILVITVIIAGRRFNRHSEAEGTYNFAEGEMLRSEGRRIPSRSFADVQDDEWGKWERRISKLLIGIIGLVFLVMTMGHIRPLSSRFPRLLGYLFLPEIANFWDLYSRPTVIEYVKVTGAELYRQGIPWYFGVYRWLSFTLPIWVYRIIKVILLVSLGGWIIGRLKKPIQIVRWKPLGLVILSAGVYAAGLLGWNFFYWKSHGFSLGIQGRYFFPNLAEHMVLLMGGLSMMRKKLIIFLAVLGAVIFNWYSWRLVAASYFDAGSFQTFFLQMSQYKPWFFKTPFLLGIIGLGIINSGWFLWEFGVELFKGKENC